MEGSLQKKDRGNPYPVCYICNGSHLARDCLNRSKLNAIVAENGQDGGLDFDDLERIAPLQLLSAIRVMKAKSHPKLMFVCMDVNRYQISDMVDIGVTYGFVAEKMVTP